MIGMKGMIEIKTALITGASSGIGYELACLFAKDQFNLVLIARDVEKLKQLADKLQSKYGVEILVMGKDLSDRSAPDEIFAELHKRGWVVDILVNNAGFGALGLFHEIEINKALDMIQVNVASLTHLTRLLIPSMIKRGSGKILNVASTAAFQPGPLMAVYYATKAYVLSFSEAIANELKETGVTLSVLCPGPTKTGFQTRASMEESKLFSNQFLKVMDAETVARIGYSGLMKNKTVIIPGMLNRLLVQSNRLAPRKWVSTIVRKIQERRK